jgi:hypothetical protein
MHRGECQHLGGIALDRSPHRMIGGELGQGLRGGGAPGGLISHQPASQLDLEPAQP